MGKLIMLIGLFSAMLYANEYDTNGTSAADLEYFVIQQDIREAVRGIDTLTIDELNQRVTVLNRDIKYVEGNLKCISELKYAQLRIEYEISLRFDKTDYACIRTQVNKSSKGTVYQSEINGSLIHVRDYGVSITVSIMQKSIVISKGTISTYGDGAYYYQIISCIATLIHVGTVPLTPFQKEGLRVFCKGITNK